MATYSVSEEGVKRLDRWERARKRVEDLKRELSSAECEFSNARISLGEWMVPKEPENDDTEFNIWLGDGLLSAKRDKSGYHEVKWRKRPSEKQLPAY